MTETVLAERHHKHDKDNNTGACRTGHYAPRKVQPGRLAWSLGGKDRTRGCRAVGSADVAGLI
ncbi:MAG TPA: hypothetical protein VNZ64_02370 [Candidatus Acidoferrum sp.]|jgi:hypothetical protein|nr:hypothetical protein [Candidatus Acidoferrum sp.]